MIADNRMRRRARSGVGDEAEQIVRGFARLGSGSHDGAVVFAQNFEPSANVIGVTHGRHNPKRGAAERGAQLRYQFFEGVFLGAVGSTLVAVEARGMPRRMTEFMQRGAMPIDRLEIGLRRRTCT
jgi:hypothetical protein